MTVAQPESSGAEVAPYDEDMANLGMEDVDASDLVIPRLSIDHKRCVFVNGLSKDEFPALTVVILGLVKQRIMWPDKLEDDSHPRCKSPDHKHGFPNMRPNDPKRWQFPWDASNFTPDQAQEIPFEETADHPEGWSSNGYKTLPCNVCNFAKWGKDEDNKSVPPPCAEQHTYPLLYLTQSEEGDKWNPAIFTVQRSAITNSKAFINTFAQSRQAFFTYYTFLTLRQEMKGGNEYAVPEFKRSSPSDRNEWGNYATQLKQIRAFLRAAPRPQDEEDAPPPQSNNENTPPPSAPAPTPAPQQAQAPAPQVAQPQSVAPPAPPPAAAPPPPPPAAALPTPPAAAPAPAAPTPPAPPTPPTPAAPPTAPETPAAATPPASGDDDLPF